MGRQINALIGKERTLANLAAKFGMPEATKTVSDLWILPLDEQRIDALAMSAEPSFDGFTYLRPQLANAIGKALGEGLALYIETAYFGGMGGQGAALFENGKLIWHRSESTFQTEKPKSLFARLIGARNSPSKSPISEGLACLGVVASNDEDEFDSAGLRHFRSMETLGIEYDD